MTANTVVALSAICVAYLAGIWAAYVAIGFVDRCGMRSVLKMDSDFDNTAAFFWPLALVVLLFNWLGHTWLNPYRLGQRLADRFGCRRSTEVRP